MKKLLLLPFMLAGTVFMLSGQDTTPAFIKDSLDIIINRELLHWKIPGAAIAIVKEGKAVIVKGYGKKSQSSNDKVDENTLFMIASNTKAFTGTLLSWLQYDKKCSLDDKIVKWLPDFIMKDPLIARDLNITDVLCHHTGMGTWQGDFIFSAPDLTKALLFEKFGMLTPLNGLRSKYGYSNFGYLIAGECIERISGESWETNIKKRIFDPLQMDRSITFCSEIPLQKNIAAPHTVISDTLKLISYWEADGLAPAGSISSSAADMSHWLICQLDSGRYGGKQVIPFPVILETREPKSIIGHSWFPFNRTHYSLYGLGWQLTDYEGREIVSHTGEINGFVSSVTLLPEEKLGVVVLTNTDQNYFHESLKWMILDAYLNLPYRNYSNFFFEDLKTDSQRRLARLKAQKDTVAMHKEPLVDLKNFTGHYINPIYGYLDILRTNEYLTMTFEHHPDLSGRLECLGGSRFLCTYSDPVYGIKVLSFKIESSKVKSMKLRVADFVEPNEYEFVKQ
jgi:CubicO group peptidase (beta-lactamase class C family)